MFPLVRQCQLYLVLGCYVGLSWVPNLSLTPYKAIGPRSVSSLQLSPRRTTTGLTLSHPKMSFDASYGASSYELGTSEDAPPDATSRLLFLAADRLVRANQIFRSVQAPQRFTLIGAGSNCCQGLWALLLTSQLAASLELVIDRCTPRPLSLSPRERPQYSRTAMTESNRPGNSCR